MVTRLIPLLLLCLLPLKALALTQLQASVDRNPVTESEYFMLSVVADDELEAQALDTSALLKDFIVGRTSVSRSTQIINFDARKETRWQVMLAPKTTGQVTIPALSIDGVSSDAIELKVMPAGSRPEAQKNLFLRTSISAKEAYVGQLLTYKVKLFLAVELQRGVLSAPSISGAQIKQLGEDKESSEIVNGRRFRVIERSYGIIADEPGELAISGANFSGDVLVDTPRRGMFAFQESRPMQAQSDSMLVSIKPIPAEYHGDWLISDLVMLKEEWDDKQTFEVGRPITRNLTLLASNADETSLPELKLSLPDNLKSYPEKAQRKTFVRDNQLVSQLTQTIAIVPSKPGSYTLPEIKVPWWNPHLKQQEFALLPARTIQVAPAADMPQPTINQPAQEPGSSAGFWPWLTALFASLWLATCVLWLKARRQQAPTAPATVLQAQTSQTQPGLSQACQQGDLSQVFKALQQELSDITGHSVTLDELPQLAPELAAVVAKIQATRYGRQGGDPGQHFPALLQAFERFKSQYSNAADAASVLAPLNP
ncbi:BatD family protein [Shewanella algae]|uniref:BatD family protein n=1 Tax=Shewanella algae TaxID=38313 RepID=UPI0012DDB7AC|nr:BatD family protein [Shewanella algae]QGS59625.1 protein BatD [Shewanella algae]